MIHEVPQYLRRVLARGWNSAAGAVAVALGRRRMDRKIRLPAGRHRGAADPQRGRIARRFPLLSIAGKSARRGGLLSGLGVFNETSGALAIIPGAWYLKPRNYLPAAFNGTVDARGENFEGRIVGLEGCASVFLSRATPTLPLPSVCARGLP